MSGIKIEGVTKQYGDTLALDNVSLAFEAGKIYGLLGRNGAGKTTLLNIVTGRHFAGAGQVLLDGAPIPENDAALGRMYMLSEAMLYPENMKVKDAYKWSAEFYPGFDSDYVMQLAAEYGINLKKKVSTLSTGYKTIFKLTIALASGADYLLLDEPVLGLDANHRELFYRQLLEVYAKTNCCVVLSTHLVEEVSALVEDVVIIKEGRVLKNQSRDSMLAAGYTVSGPAALVDSYTAGKEVLGVDMLGGLKSAHLLGQRPDAPPEGLELATLDLQRLFVQLTN